MAAPTVQADRILPLHNYTGKTPPHAAIQSITMGIRIGTNKYAIGYIHKFSFKMARDTKPIWQIEPYPDVMGDDASAAGMGASFSNRTFDENTTYWPGEAVEIIPGKMSPIDLTLSRYALYTGNLMAAVSRASGSGVYDSTETYPNIPEGSAQTAIMYVNILQQVRPFDIYQIFISPITGKVLWGRKFGGCWFKSVGETIPESDKNEPILEDGEVSATYIRPLSVGASLT